MTPGDRSLCVYLCVIFPGGFRTVNGQFLNRLFQRQHSRVGVCLCSLVWVPVPHQRHPHALAWCPWSKLRAIRDAEAVEVQPPFAVVFPVNSRRLQVRVKAFVTALGAGSRCDTL